MWRIGIRLWLAAAFAAVALLTAGVVYLFGDRPRAGGEHQRRHLGHHGLGEGEADRAQRQHETQT